MESQIFESNDHVSTVLCLQLDNYSFNPLSRLSGSSGLTVLDKLSLIKVFLIKCGDKD